MTATVLQIVGLLIVLVVAFYLFVPAGFIVLGAELLAVGQALEGE